MKKHRTTAFTRLLIFLAIFLPTVFVGVNLLQEKDPIVEFKKVIGLHKAENTVQNEKTSQELTIDMLRSQVEQLQKELKFCQESH